MELNYNAWELFSQGKTPGTTPLPEKLPQYLEVLPTSLVVDVGCGWGRVATWLYLKGYSVIGTDINENEISQAIKDSQKVINPALPNKLSFRVDDAVSGIGLADSIADGVTVNGVLLAMTKPEDRIKFIHQIHRILKPGGILYLAEFGQTSDSEYNVDYRKHALITGEFGTIVGFKPSLGITFRDKSDEDIVSLGKPENIDYFAHHFSEQELRGLLVDFEVKEFNLEKFTTRSGKKINGFVVYAANKK